MPVFVQDQDLMEEYYLSKYATLSVIKSRRIAVCTVLAAFIPKAEFEKLLNEAGEIIKQEELTKFIIDKRKLTAFHQPSMEWYHLVWKEEMYRYGLQSHRKLLPDDKLFELNVINGRKKIMREHPEFDFGKYDIVYCKTLEEAIES